MKLTPPPGFSEGEVVIDGARLHFMRGGAPGAPPIVLVPGQSMPWQSYLKVLPRLATSWEVFAVDVRGHGRSEHTPGHYSFGRCADDLVGLLRDVVGRPAIVSGNSSGGIIAMTAAARAPELVRAVHMEDPPLFSSEWPRMRDDTWVHGFFVDVVRQHPDIATFFSQLRVPQKGRVRLMTLPRPVTWVLGGAIRRRQARAPGQPVDIPWLPLHLRLFVWGLSTYDVDFTAACTDGRMCDVDHGATLAAVGCPVTLMVAWSFRHETLGLVGAMAEEDVERARTLGRDLVVERLAAPHVVHIADPAAWVRSVEALAARAPLMTSTA
jgi:pimeloyl-ACP methyl ester carboxylesterase